MNAWTRFLFRCRTTIGLVTAALILAGTATPAFADDCGQPPPRNFAYSSDFARAQARAWYESYSRSTKTNSSGGLKYTEAFVQSFMAHYGTESSEQINILIQGWETLSLSEAIDILESEYSNHGTQIAAECGYRICQILGSGASGVALSQALAYYASTCDAASGGGRFGNALAGQHGEVAEDVSARPFAMVLPFDEFGTPITRSLVVLNQGFFDLDLDVLIEGDAADRVRINDPSELRLSPARGKRISLTFLPPSSKRMEEVEIYIEHPFIPQITASVKVTLIPWEAIPVRRVTCEQGEKCPGEVVSCTIAAGDIDGGATVRSGIKWGPWENPECERSGYGWYAPMGTCMIGRGRGFKPCAFVTVDQYPRDLGKLTRCREYQYCEGEVVGCKSVGDDSDRIFGWIDPAGLASFGPWTNSGCGTSGKGWHMPLGSCSGSPSPVKRCEEVKVATD